MTTSQIAPRVAGDRVHPYDRWTETQGIPVYREYHVDDVRTLKLGGWDLRGCDAAFLQLAGQEGVSAATVMEIPPKATLPPFRIAIDEVAYVAQGRGLTTIWAEGHRDSPSSGASTVSSCCPPTTPTSWRTRAATSPCG